MFTHIRKFLLKTLLLLAAGSAVLQAQMDPRLQRGKTDFLDLYQASGNKKAKPEVVTLFDFSGSMEAVMFHEQFPNANINDSATGDGNMTFTRSGAVGTYNVTASLSLSNASAFGGAFTNLTNGILIRPDGTQVTRANVALTSGTTSVLLYGAAPSSVTLAGQAAAVKDSDVRNWIRACSHVRFSYNHGGTIRTLDIPVPWRIMNASSSGYPLSGQTVADTGLNGTGLNIELDTSFAVSGAQSNVWTNSSTTASVLIPNYRTSYVKWLFTGMAGGKYVIPDALNASLSQDGLARKAFANGIPARTRTQAVKEAAIRTWVGYQNKVFWAFRFLNPGGENSITNLTPSTTSPGITNATTFSTTPTTGNDRSWYLLNNTAASPDNSRTGMQRIAALFASGNTPLTYAVANTLAQFQDASNVFNAVEVGDDKPQDCTKHFLIAFTDGQPTSDSNSLTSAVAYVDSGTTGSADQGNKLINAAGTASMNPGSGYWNIINWAGAAAHGQDSDISVTNKIPVPTYPAGASTAQNFVPAWIKSRAGVTFSTPHPVQVMTVGVSLAGNPTDPAAGKFRLFASATVGDPRVHAWDLNNVAPFELTNPADPTSSPVTGSVFYFDAASPDKLVTYLQSAFYSIDNIAGQNITSTPVVPFSGVALAKQIYLGRFDLPDPTAPSPYWNGDLLMFPTGNVNNQTQILQNDGTAISSLDSSTAQLLSQWSAKSILNQPNFWATRKVYTRASATLSNPNPGLSNFTDATGTGNLDDFQASMDPALTLAAKQNLIRWTRGGDVDSGTVPIPNRPNLMGDIINSTPAVLEYSASTPGLPASLVSALSGHPGAKLRVLYVGTNTGFLHAFGEVSWEVPYIRADGKSDTMIRGTAAELWSFVPTDFLPYLSYLRNNLNLHRFMVDGSPTIYHQDRPAGSSLAGDNVVNNNENAFVIFGLRKGGRSYYSLDVSDPLNPKMAWALNPAEAATIPASRVLKGVAASVQALVGSMGFSSSQPNLGRVLYTEPSGALRIRRAVFLGGGLSVPEIEESPTTSPLPGGFGKKLGLNAFALDAATGEFLQTWDFSSLPGISSIPAGVVPFEYFSNSSMVQRAYFSDRGGNVWALGSGQKVAVTPYTGFRLDTSSLDRWTVDGNIGSAPAVRAIYKAPANDKSSTMPSPFNMSTFPAIRTSDPKISPAAVGIAFVSGDRNNPLDLWYSSGNPAPSQHRVNVVFDRQDSYLLGIDTAGISTGQMQDMTSQTSQASPLIDPSNNSYYLKSKYGYYINFPAPSTSGTQTFIPKGLNEPAVLAGVLFYSYFKPTKGDTCNPGAGLTRSWRVCDVINPTVSSGSIDTTKSVCTPGFTMEWAGVASNFAAKGTAAVTQAGGVLDVGGGGASGSGVGTGKVAIGTATGSYSETFPKPRVWRSVHSDQN